MSDATWQAEADGNGMDDPRAMLAGMSKDEARSRLLGSIREKFENLQLPNDLVKGVTLNIARLSKDGYPERVEVGYEGKDLDLDDEQVEKINDAIREVSKKFGVQMIIVGKLADLVRAEELARANDHAAKNAASMGPGSVSHNNMANNMAYNNMANMASSQNMGQYQENVYGPRHGRPIFSFSFSGKSKEKSPSGKPVEQQDASRFDASSNRERILAAARDFLAMKPRTERQAHDSKQTHNGEPLNEHVKQANDSKQTQYESSIMRGMAAARKGLGLSQEPNIIDVDYEVVSQEPDIIGDSKQTHNGKLFNEHAKTYESPIMRGMAAARKGLGLLPANSQESGPASIDEIRSALDRVINKEHGAEKDFMNVMKRGVRDEDAKEVAEMLDKVKDNKELSEAMRKFITKLVDRIRNFFGLGPANDSGSRPQLTFG